MARKFTKFFIGDVVIAVGKRVFRKVASLFTLPKPTLVIDGDEMIIGDPSGLAKGVEIYANGILVKRFRTGATYSLTIKSQLGELAFKPYSERVKLDFAPTSDIDYDYDARTIGNGETVAVTASSYWVWSTAKGYAKATEVELTNDSTVTIKYGNRA